MKMIPDNPVIKNMEATGYPDGKEPRYPSCPVCESDEISELYVCGEDGSAAGCDCCVTATDAYEYDGSDSPSCPVCQMDCDTYYVRGRTVLGCENCIDIYDAWDRPECFGNGNDPDWLP